MKKALYGSLAFMLALACQVASAKVKVTEIAWERTSNGAQAVVYYQGDMRDTPALMINKDTVQLTFQDAIVWPKIDKKARLDADFDTTLTAYQYTSDVVRFRATIPATIKNHEGVGVILGEGKVTVSIPKGSLGSTQKAAVAAAKSDEVMQKIDRDVAEAEAEAQDRASENYDPMAATTAAAPKMVDPMAEKDGPKAQAESGMMTHVGKFASFLGLMLLVLLGVTKFFKKGMASKAGKLGLLTSSDALTVLKTTYIGPKKSLMMVKAHNQVFLISSSEAGIHFLSEIKDVAGVMKEGERNLTGANFDAGLEEASQGNLQQLLKEDITRSSEPKEKGLAGGLKEIAATVRESVKISDQIKSKVKSLRPLQ